LQYFHKTHKTPEKHRKTLKNTKTSQYARVLWEFSKSKKIRLYCTKHLSQNICKTPQNTAKQSQNAFCEIRRKTPQNARKTLENVTKRSQYSRNTYCALSVFSPKNTLDLSRKHKIRNIRVNYEGGARTRRGSRSRIVDVFQKQCFAVFCGVLWCFAVFCVRVFSVFHKTAQNIP